jgi:ferredoxin
VVVTVDRGLCIGAQTCRAIVPELFEIDDEGLAVVVAGGRAPIERIEQAVVECPTQAIRVERAVQAAPREGAS